MTSLPPDLAKRSEDDFKFMVVCSSKGNMSFYHAFKDQTLAADIEAYKKGAQSVSCDD